MTCWLACAFIFVVQPGEDVSEQFEAAGKVFDKFGHEDGAAIRLQEGQVFSQSLRQLQYGDVRHLKPFAIEIVDSL